MGSAKLSDDENTIKTINTMDADLIFVYAFYWLDRCFESFNKLIGSLLLLQIMNNVLVAGIIIAVAIISIAGFAVIESDTVLKNEDVSTEIEIAAESPPKSYKVELFESMNMGTP